MAEKKIFVITGATRGIGKALVALLIERGHQVIGCGRSEPGVEEMRNAFGDPHRFDTLDVTHWEQVLAWARAVMEQAGPPQVLINNAGVINQNAPLWEVGDEEFTQVITTNVMGTANLIRAFLPAMIEARTGLIINISSGWGRTTAPQVAPYCASKWAVEGLTQALSQELPSGLAAVAVNPGVIDTDMLRTCWGEAAGDCPDPDQWAQRAVDFLLSLSEKDNGKSLSVG